MTAAGLAGWIWLLAAFTLTGSLSARKYGRPTLLCALIGALAATGQILTSRIAVLQADESWVAPPGLVPLAVTHLALCAVTEKFGQAEGHRAALFAVVAQMLALAAAAGANALPSAPGQPEAIAPVLLHPWVALASLTGYVVGANFCVVLYHMLRVLTADRHLWLRGFLGPMLGGCVETFVTVPLAFGGRDPLGPLLAGRLAGWLWVSTTALPFVYAHRAALGRRA